MSATERAKKRTRRPRLWDRLILRMFDIRRAVDGIEIVCWNELEFDRVAAALDLIRKSDPLRYTRLHRDIVRVVVHALPGNRAQYAANRQAVEIDTRYVRSDTVAIADLASVIVHEATHARLENLGIGYEEQRRPRIRRCMPAPRTRISETGAGRWR